MILLESCSAQWHLKRAIAKDPKIAQDTTVIWDTTIVTQSVRVSDTVTIKEVDTVTIVKDGVRVEMRRYFDTIAVDVECPPDTIKVYKEVPIRQVVKQDSPKSMGIGAALGIIFTIVVMRIVAAALPK